MIAEEKTYLKNVKELLIKTWPENRAVNLVFHGHSVPSGYFRTPNVNSLQAYPFLVWKSLKEHYPYAVINQIVTAIGGENSVQGAKRFDAVLNHQPDVLFIDYALNDRYAPFEQVKAAWSQMIEKALAKDIKVILLTPTFDQSYLTKNNDWLLLETHKNQIIELASSYGVGLSDSFQAFSNAVNGGTNLHDLLSQSNHPSFAGHQLAAAELLKYFI